MPEQRIGMDDAIGKGVRAYFSNWFFWISAAWGLIGFNLVLHFRAPVGRALGFEFSAEALLIDFCLLIAPVAIALVIHTQRLNARRRAARQRFVEDHTDVPLLTFVYGPNRIFRVLRDDADSDQIEVVAVWNATGLVDGAAPSRAPRDAFVAFDPAAFVEGT